MLKPPALPSKTPITSLMGVFCWGQNDCEQECRSSAVGSETLPLRCPPFFIVAGRSGGVPPPNAGPAPHTKKAPDQSLGRGLPLGSLVRRINFNLSAASHKQAAGSGTKGNHAPYEEPHAAVRWCAGEGFRYFGLEGICGLKAEDEENDSDDKEGDGYTFVHNILGWCLLDEI